MIKDKILAFMREEAYKPMMLEELSSIFNVNRNDLKEFTKVLEEMEVEGLIIKTRKNKYGVPERMNLIVGKLQGHSKGFGFVIPENTELKDVYVPAENLNGAMNNDKVIVKITKENVPGKKIEGEIIRILKHANIRIVGTFEKSDNFGFVVPDDKRIYQDIFITKGNTNGANHGHKVVVEITKWPEKRRNPEGNVIEILGNADAPGVDILSIIRKYDLPEAFPDEVEAYAANISEEISPGEISHRRDLRDLKIVTIDGEDAKDLDDAVSIEKLKDGKYRLGVHIADVTHYVKEKSPLDREAFDRGTSVYLVDRVIPMLPRKLSNGICSLNPNVDRLTMSCMMTIDSEGKVVEHDIFESVIKTSERMTYTDVTMILKDKDPELLKRYDYLIEEFNNMEELCMILNAKRMRRGALDFDFDETKIILNDNGEPIDIKPYEREIANRIIEEFMLVCNETIAEHMFWTGVPFVYRIHEDPDEEKLTILSEFIHNLGLFLRVSGEMHPKALQEILEQVKGKKEEIVVNTLLLRSLKQARYAPDSTGHFGLAAKYYCHFTSPIRRYPDLAIHRIIREFITGRLDDKKINKLKKFVAEASIQSSEMERRAQEAERETDDLKKVEYMSNKIGQIYSGVISSVTSFGIFIELENTIEGLVHISNMLDDYYIYDEKHHSLMGERLRKIYRLGDEIRVKVAKTNIETRTIDFELVETETGESENA